MASYNIPEYPCSTAAVQGYRKYENKNQLHYFLNAPCISILPITSQFDALANAEQCTNVPYILPRFHMRRSRSHSDVNMA